MTYILVFLMGVNQFNEVIVLGEHANMDSCNRAKQQLQFAKTNMPLTCSKVLKYKEK